MKVSTFASQQEAGAYIAGCIIEIVKRKPDALLCLAAGHTSLPVFDALITAYKAGTVDFAQTRIVGVDEWLGMENFGSGSCGRFLKTNFFDKVNLQMAHIRLFDSQTQNPDGECKAVEAFIDSRGGMDYLLLGMGMNGHLALNEPGESFTAGAHVAPLAQTTKEVAPKYFPEGMPPIESGITLGIGNLMAARVIQLAVFGAHKQKTVKRLLEGEISTDCPATALRTREDTELVLDEEAAG